jgi:putative glutamine amidotransferase
VIGITGSVVLPGARGDSGLGNDRVTRTYREAITRAGALPLHLVPVPADRVAELLGALDGLLLAGGPDIDPAAYGEDPHPTVSVLPVERQQFDLALVEEAMARRLPVLGICLGSQLINVARGGDMIQDIPSEVGGAVSHRRLALADLRRGVHEVTLVEGTRFAGLYGVPTLRVNSAHHQAADRLGAGLVVAARAPDGVIEAHELPGHPFLIGVQFHPEMQTDPAGLHDKLFEEFVAAAAAYRAAN